MSNLKIHQNFRRVVYRTKSQRIEKETNQSSVPCSILSGGVKDFSKMYQLSIVLISLGGTKPRVEELFFSPKV